MPGTGPTPINAEELLSLLQRSISYGRGLSPRVSAVCWVEKDGDNTFIVPFKTDSNVPPPVVETSSLPVAIQAAQTAMETHAGTIGSLPLSPGTLRGRIGLALVWIVNRFSWWQITIQKNFALAVCDFARTLSGQHAQIYAASEHIRSMYTVLQERDLPLQQVFDRLAQVEQHTQELRRYNIESRVIARFEARFACIEDAQEATDRALIEVRSKAEKALQAALDTDPQVDDGPLT